MSLAFRMTFDSKFRAETHRYFAEKRLAEAKINAETKRMLRQARGIEQGYAPATGDTRFEHLMPDFMASRD